MLPKVQSAGFQEHELSGCPLITVGGLECVSLARVARMLGVDRREAAKMLAEYGPLAPGHSPLFAQARMVEPQE